MTLVSLFALILSQTGDIFELSKWSILGRPDRMPAEQRQPIAEDYDVLSVALSHVVEGRKNCAILVSYRTVATFEMPIDTLDNAFQQRMTEIRKAVHSGLMDLRSDTLQDYISNRSPIALQQRFFQRTAVVVLTKENRELIDRVGVGNSSLRRLVQGRMPCRGIYSSSLPGFSTDRRQALVFVEWSTEEVVAKGHFVLLEKMRRTWRIRASVKPWIVVGQKLH